jgi:hypothetical protein
MRSVTMQVIRMKAKITLTAKKTWVDNYPDNDFSDEIITDNFWLYRYDQDKFMENSKVTIKRTRINKTD